MTFTTHQDAATWLSITRADLERGTWAPKAKSKMPAFAEYAEQWMRDRALKPRTAAHYKSILDRFLLPEFGDAALDGIAPIEVRRWHAELQTGPTLKAHAYGLLRTITRAAVADGYLTASPCTVPGAGQAKRASRTEPATLAQLEAIMAAMPENRRLMIMLASWTALRFGEITELRRRDVDAKTGVLHIRRAVAWINGKPIIGAPKSNAGVRDVNVPAFMSPMIRGHIREHAQWGADGLLFPSPSGGNLTTSSLYTSFWRAREAAGRPDLRFHDLRHTGAVLAASTGATLAELMNRLGHSTPSAALRYQHAAAGRDRQIADALNLIYERGAE